MKRIAIWVGALSWLTGIGAQAAADLPPAEPVEMHVRQAPLRDVLTGLARLSGDNLIIAGDVDGTVTIDITGATPEEALAWTAAAGHVVIERQGNARIVYAKSGTSDQAREAAAIPLRYADVETIRDNLTAILPPERVRMNPAAGSVVVYGTGREIAQARAVVAALDRAVRQVQVEVEVVSVHRDRAKEIGVDWDWSGISTATAPTPAGYTALTFGTAAGGHPYTWLVRAKLDALVADGSAEILARPNIMTLNGHEASILIGNKIPVAVERGRGDDVVTTTEYRDAGIRLRYTPYIGADGSITARIYAEVATPYLEPALKAYRIVTREAQTTVCLQDGEPLVIGGLTDRERELSERRVPLLADIPLLGKLFRHRDEAQRESEVMIFVTAHTVPPTDGKDRNERNQSHGAEQIVRH